MTIVEGDRDTVRRARAAGLETAVPMLEALIASTGCYVAEVDAPVTLRLSITRLNDTHLPTHLVGPGRAPRPLRFVTADVSLALTEGTRRIESLGSGAVSIVDSPTGPLLVTREPAAPFRSLDTAYRAALRYALEDGLNKLIRSTSGP